MTHTIALPTENEFEFLASILSTWDNTSEGILHKRHALDQLLVRSEIDGYEKSRVEGDRNLLMWKKQGSDSDSDLVVFVSRAGYGLYDVLIHSRNISVRSMNIEEL